MPKFSVIIPVYNVEKYIKRCLDSVFAQTFDDYEVIVVNDGTKDKSMDIVEKYPVKIINQKNKGLSEARNIGIKNASGKYIIFLDSDDYWNKDLLKKLNESEKNNPDVIRFQIKEEYENNTDSKEYKEIEFEDLNGVEAFKKISEFHFVEVAWSYAYKREYFISEKFKFMPNVFHEDFGLIPLVIMKAEKVNSINYIGYNYLQRNGSIMNNTDYEKTKKKVKDMYEQYKFLKNEINKTNLDSIYFKSFIANSILLKINELNNKDYKKYIKILKQEKIFDNLIEDTLFRKIKKTIVKLSPKLYYKILRK